MRIKICLIVLFSVIFSGCGQKFIYKDVILPVKCTAKMPQKPKNNGDFESHKKLIIYFLECENLLKFCLGVEK